MSAPFRVPSAPVDQQAPPARAAACDSKPLRVARGSLLLITGTGSHRDPPRDRILRQDGWAWEVGYRAGLLGVSHCPYHPRSLQAWSWSSGWIEGKAARVAKHESSS
jgi:ribosome modulation factor